MAQTTEAIHTNGVLRPKDELALREGQCVRLIIETLDEDIDRGDRHAALQRLLAGIERMRFFSPE